MVEYIPLYERKSKNEPRETTKKLFTPWDQKRFIGTLINSPISVMAYATLLIGPNEAKNKTWVPLNCH